MRTRSLLRQVARRAGTARDYRASRSGAADVALFHEFHEPPYGGGNQFLLALVGELARRGLAVETNRISGGTPACLYNSFNFDFRRLKRFARDGVRMVHRVDGPIGVYRGFDDGTDARIASINRELADATVVQSRYSLEKHVELGIELRDPVVIRNTVDPQIFHLPASREAIAGRRLRIISTSWSDNPRKGADALEWLDANLDLDEYELTFVGRTQARLERTSVLGPVPSGEVAELLRAHDIYLAASRDDPCSNGLLEALACGLPRCFPSQWRPSRARRGGRDRVRRTRGAAPGVGTACCGDRGAACPDQCAVTRRRGRSLSERPERVTSAIRRLTLGVYVLARTASWPEASRLFVAGDDVGWSIDDDRARLTATARRLGYDVPPAAWARFARRQSVFHHDHFAALQPRWLESSHRLGLSYFHGRPERPAIRSSTARTTRSRCTPRGSTVSR